MLVLPEMKTGNFSYLCLWRSGSPNRVRAESLRQCFTAAVDDVPKMPGAALFASQPVAARLGLHEPLEGHDTQIFAIGESNLKQLGHRHYVACGHVL